MSMRRSARPGAIVVSVALTFAFALSLMLFLGVSQFTEAVRAAILVRLGIAADEVTLALQDATRVGVTVQNSPPVVAQLRAAQHSDPVIATVALVTAADAPLVEVGDVRGASADRGLAVERAVVSDFGVTLARVHVRAEASAYAQRVTSAAYALVLPALIAGVLGVALTSGALIAAVRTFERREAMRRRALAPAVAARLGEAAAALDELEVRLR